MQSRRRYPAVLSVFLLAVCAFAPSAPAGDGVDTIGCASDGEGNARWVEVVRDGGRMRATPYVTLSPETLGGVAAAADRHGTAGLAATQAFDGAAREEGETRKERRRRALSALLQGPDGISLAGAFDLAREAHDGWRKGLRGSAKENAPAPPTRPPKDEATPAAEARFRPR